MMPKYRHTYNSYRYSTILSIKLQYLFSIFLKNFFNRFSCRFCTVKCIFASNITLIVFYNHPKLIVHLAIISFFG